MNSEFEEGRDESVEARKRLIAKAKDGIDSNIPLRKDQKKYLKNMLLFAILRTSRDSKGDLSKKANKAFKKLFVRLVYTQNLNEEDQEDEAFFEQNLNISFNHIQANHNKLDLKKLSNWLSPKNIMTQILNATGTLTNKQKLDRLAAKKDAKANHRETPQEILERKRRERTMDLNREKLFQKEAIHDLGKQLEAWQYLRMKERGGREE